MEYLMTFPLLNLFDEKKANMAKDTDMVFMQKKKKKSVTNISITLLFLSSLFQFWVICGFLMCISYQNQNN